jgi:hypothetical protein
MSQLFELVRDHVEGFDTIAQEWQTADGIKTVNITLARPAAWIERVHEKGVLTALDCLALIFFVLDDWSAEPTREQEVQLVEGWAAELRRAATAGEIQARHPFTLLPLPNVPEGLDWGLLASDADKFVTARGMAWNFGDIAAHIYREVLTDIESKRFPSFLEGATPAQPQAAAPAPAAKETPAERRARWLDMFEAEEKLVKRGALQRLAKREGVDRSNMAKDIAKARAERADQKRAGVWASQLVQDGKRKS